MQRLLHPDRWTVIVNKQGHNEGEALKRAVTSLSQVAAAMLARARPP